MLDIRLYSPEMYFIPMLECFLGFLDLATEDKGRIPIELLAPCILDYNIAKRFLSLEFLKFKGRGIPSYLHSVEQEGIMI